MEMLERRIEYFSILLNTEEKLSGVGAFPGTGDEMYDETVFELINNQDSIIYVGEFANLFYQLTHITNYGTMEEVQGTLTKIGIGATMEADEYRPVYYSPYGIYYLWMENYQYLPANMQTGN